MIKVNLFTEIHQGRSSEPVFSGGISVFFESLFIFATCQAHEKKAIDPARIDSRQNAMAMAEWVAPARRSSYSRKRKTRHRRVLLNRATGLGQPALVPR